MVILTKQCSTWTFGYAPPCCTNSNLNLSGSSSTYVQATLESNGIKNSVNNSPVYNNRPIPTFCAGQDLTYHFGITDDDGDSLVYSFDCGYTSLGVPNRYAFPYQCAAPFLGATMDSSTGMINFTAILAGNYIVIAKVCDYDRKTGLLKGCVL